MSTKVRAARAVLGSIGAWIIALNGATAAPPPDDRFHLRDLVPPPPKTTCGIYAFYACARASGRTDMSAQQMEEALSPIGPRGVSAAALAQVAQQNHIPMNPVHVELETLAFWNQPAILHVYGSHYVSFLGTESGRFIFLDPSLGIFDCTPDWFTQHYRWEGTALVFGSTPSRWLALLEWPAVLPAGVGFFAVAFVVGIFQESRAPRTRGQRGVVRVDSGAPRGASSGDV